MTGPVSGRISILEAEVLGARTENVKLRWIIAQLMQRMGKDMVLLHMDNPVKFDLAIHESPEKRQIDIRLKRTAENIDVPNTDSGPPLN